jgi:hypothetical protein
MPTIRMDFMDIFQRLRDAEYALKDHVEAVLQEKIGPDWIARCGIREDRLETWRKRKDAVDPGGEGTGERLIAYGDLSDLALILREQWDASFSDVFGDLATMDVYLRVLERYRDSGKRELWMYEKCLIYGISGEILARIARYRQRRETAEEYFPKSDEVLDNMGNQWKSGAGKMVFTRTLLKPGDDLEIAVKVFDPDNWTLQYGIKPDSSLEISWSQSNRLFYRVKETDVKQPFFVTLLIRSSRNYHAMGSFDDFVNLGYVVAPKNK